MRQPAARLKGLKGSLRVLQDPETQQYIALDSEHQPPRLVELHLATIAPDTPAGRAWLERLASRRSVACEAVRVDLFKQPDPQAGA